MTWQDYALARQLLVEKYIGTRVREARAVEDAKFARTGQAIKRSKRLG
jgi:hypothetical protein